VEDIAKKLEMFHTYEDEIAAAKQEYNSSQMFHIMDEAEEEVLNQFFILSAAIYL